MRGFKRFNSIVLPDSLCAALAKISPYAPLDAIHYSVNVSIQTDTGAVWFRPTPPHWGLYRGFDDTRQVAETALSIALPGPPLALLLLGYDVRTALVNPCALKEARVTSKSRNGAVPPTRAHRPHRCYPLLSGNALLAIPLTHPTHSTDTICLYYPSWPPRDPELGADPQ